jgi:arabinofuranosyltransferase
VFVYPKESRIRASVADAAIAAALATVVIVQVAVIVTGPGDPFVDDSYISLRYARHLVGGHGLVFNPGERVEGYTHPLWVLLEAIVLSVGLAPRASLQIAGVICWIGATISTLRASRESGASREAQILSSGAVAFAAMGSFWSLAGLETAAFTWAAVEAVRFALATSRGQPRDVSAGVAFGLACWLRPEGALALATCASAQVIVAWRSGSLRPAFAAAVRMVAVAAALFAPWEVFRLVYYHAWLPNTFWAKTGGSAAWMLERGGAYLADVVRHGPLVALVAALILAPRAFRRAEVAVPAAVALSFLAFVVWAGGDYMPFGRLVVPALPLFALAMAGCMGEMQSRGLAWLGRGVAMAVCVTGLLGHVGSQRVRAFENATARYLVAGAWLRDRVPPETLVSTPGAGAIGWIGRTRVLDEFGLTDSYLARHLDPRLDPEKLRAPAGHSKGNASYVLERMPDLVLLANVWVRPVPLTPAALQKNLGITSITDRLLLQDGRFFERYEILNYRIDGSTWLGMAVRRASALHPAHPAFRGPSPTTDSR